LDWRPDERRRIANEVRVFHTIIHYAQLNLSSIYIFCMFTFQSRTFTCPLCGPIADLLPSADGDATDTPSEDMQAQIRQLRLHHIEKSDNGDSEVGKMSAEEKAREDSDRGEVERRGEPSVGGGDLDVFHEGDKEQRDEESGGCKETESTATQTSGKSSVKRQAFHGSGKDRLELPSFASLSDISLGAPSLPTTTTFLRSIVSTQDEDPMVAGALPLPSPSPASSASRTPRGTAFHRNPPRRLPSRSPTARLVSPSVSSAPPAHPLAPSPTWRSTVPNELEGVRSEVDAEASGAPRDLEPDLVDRVASILLTVLGLLILFLLYRLALRQFRFFAFSAYEDDL